MCNYSQLPVYKVHLTKTNAVLYDSNKLFSFNFNCFREVSIQHYIQQYSTTYFKAVLLDCILFG